MNTLNLNAAGVMELNTAEVQDIHGGLSLKDVVTTAYDIWKNWDAYSAAFKKGFSEGRKFI